MGPLFVFHAFEYETILAEDLESIFFTLMHDFRMLSRKTGGDFRIVVMEENIAAFVPANDDEVLIELEPFPEHGTIGHHEAGSLDWYHRGKLILLLDIAFLLVHRWYETSPPFKPYRDGFALRDTDAYADVVRQYGAFREGNRFDPWLPPRRTFQSEGAEAIRKELSSRFEPMTVDFPYPLTSD